MDAIVYHYPPDLFQLLVQVIPKLCRSKNDVLLFFKGAGVDSSTLTDLWQQVKENRTSISKYDIARTVLDRLNQKGEATLRERREILKRVTEYEDFSGCWQNDQLAAMGLVAEVRKVLDVKDSFARMNIEREKERKKHQKKYESQLLELEERRAELASIKNDLFSLFSVPDEAKKKRGTLLEGVLNRLFKADGILVREAFQLVGEEGEGVIAQIDGVAEIDGYLYLVEMKWWAKPLGKIEVSPHLVNVFNRGHVGGILISASGYTKAAITVCKEALSQKVIVLCELDEIVTMLERQASLKEFLKAKLNAAAVEKKPLHKPLA